MSIANSLYNISYRQQLEKSRAGSLARKADHDGKHGDSRLPLADRISQWWDKLPQEERQQHYRMEFFVEKFKSVPRLTGPVLFDQGWERKRIWSPKRPHYRVWCPPEKTD